MVKNVLCLQGASKQNSLFTKDGFQKVHAVLCAAVIRPPEGLDILFKQEKKIIVSIWELFNVVIFLLLRLIFG